MSLNRRQLQPQTRSEASFLADQAADAKAAMIHTLRDIKESLGKVADVRVCAQQHPWLVIGSAVAAGFVAGAVVTPAPQRKVKKTRASSHAASQPSCQGQETPRTKKSFLFSTFSTAGTFLAGILRTVVEASIAAAVVAKDPPPGETLAPHDATGAGAPESETAGKT
jgi:hypothetical protein